MRTRQYGGYARQRRKGFDPVRVPDQTQKILNETETTLRSMRQWQDQNNQNRREYLEGIKENAKIQENVRQGNEDLRKTFAKEYQKAELQHYERRLKDTQPGGGLYQDSKNKIARINQREQDMKQLWKMIPQVATQVKGAIDARNEKLQAAGSEIFTRWGLEQEELAAIKNGDRQVDWVHQALTKLDARLDAAGATADEKKAVFGLSGRRMLGAQIYAVSNMGKQSWQTFLAEDRHEEYPGLGSHQQHEIGAEGTSATSLRALLKAKRTKFLNTLVDPDGNPYYDPQFLQAHLTPHLLKSENEILGQQNDRDLSRIDEEKLEERTTALKSYMFGYGGQDIANALPRWIDIESAAHGNRAAKRDEAFALLAEMAASGELTRSQFEEMMQGEVVLGEGKNATKHVARKLWEDQAASVYKALDDRDKREFQQIESRRKVFDASMKSEVAQAVVGMGRNLNKHEVDKIEDHYLQNNYLVPQWLQKYKNVETESAEDSKYELNIRVEANVLTMAELYSNRYHSSVLKEYESKTIDGPGSISATAKAEYIGAAKNSVAAATNKILTPGEQRNSQTRIMSGKAVTILEQRVREATIAGIYKSGSEAWVQETNKLRKEIAAGEGIWAPKTDTAGNVLVGNEGGFQHLEDALEYDKAGVEYRKKAFEDKSFIYSQENFKPKHIQAIKDVKAGKPIPGFIFQLDQAYPTKDPYEIMSAISGEEIEPPGAARAPRYVHPLVKRLVTNKPSLAKTARAMKFTTVKTNPKTEANGPMIDLLKSKEVVGIDEKYNGHDAVITTRGISNGTTLYNKPIVEMTVGEIRALQRREGIRVGAFQMMGQEIQYYIDKGLISEDEVFTPELQNKLEIDEIARKSGEFTTDLGQPIPGVGQNTDDWSPEPAQDDLYTKLLENGGFGDANMFKPGIFSGVK